MLVIRSTDCSVKARCCSNSFRRFSRRPISSEWRFSAWASRPSAPVTFFSTSAAALPISSSTFWSSSVRDRLMWSAIRSISTTRSCADFV